MSSRPYYKIVELAFTEIQLQLFFAADLSALLEQYLVAPEDGDLLACIIRRRLFKQPQVIKKQYLLLSFKPKLIASLKCSYERDSSNIFEA